jgi:hypothetical protein
LGPDENSEAAHPRRRQRFGPASAFARWYFWIDIKTKQAGLAWEKTRLLTVYAFWFGNKIEVVVAGTVMFTVPLEYNSVCC